MANPSGGEGKEGGLQSYKARSVATGRPLIGAMSAINLSQAILMFVTTLAEAERFDIILHFPIIVFHFVFPLSLQRQAEQKEPRLQNQ